jgi:hypothetical protein
MAARQRIEKRLRSGDLGGTMRLGAYPAAPARGSRVSEVYGGATETERHRHRYEVNTAYKDRSSSTACASGLPPDGVLPEIVEYETTLGSSAQIPPRAEVAAVRAAPRCLRPLFRPRQSRAAGVTAARLRFDGRDLLRQTSFDRKNNNAGE